MENKNISAKLLLVEDDPRTAEFTCKGLTQSGYEVTHAADGEKALQYLKEGRFDIAVVDIMLPLMDGVSVVRNVRSCGVTTPVLFLSARNSVDDKVRGLEAGGDDYLVKPFSFTELLARLQALLRRSGNGAELARITVGDLTLDVINRKVFRAGNRIELQPMEFALLEYLMRNAGRIVSKTMIMEHVWEYNFDPQSNLVETRICRLREKVDKAGSEKLIHTVRGFGYVVEHETDFRNR